MCQAGLLCYRGGGRRRKINGFFPGWRRVNRALQSWKPFSSYSFKSDLEEKTHHEILVFAKVLAHEDKLLCRWAKKGLIRSEYIYPKFFQTYLKIISELLVINQEVAPN